MKFSSVTFYIASFYTLSSVNVILAESEKAKRRLRTDEKITSNNVKRNIAFLQDNRHIDDVYWLSYDSNLPMSMSMSMSIPPLAAPTAAPTAAPKLTDIENNLGKASYEECQGDCDYDDECIGANIRCFQRRSDELTDVPGCSGPGTIGTDYCFNATGYLFDVADDFNSSPTLLIPRNDKDANLAVTGLFECQGDCDTDDDCAGDLRCFDRSSSDFTGDSPVPGCKSPYPDREGDSGTDYCFDANGYVHISMDNNGMFAEKDLGTKLGECRGDCDENSDCAEGLICGQRDENEPLPGGCSNPYESVQVWGYVDFCCNPANDGCVNSE